MEKLLLALLLVAGSTILVGCTGIPKGVTPVNNFEAQRYLGKWYEIARLEHSFEKGLCGITANYSFRDDGGLQVLNRGYDPQKIEWRKAEGKAYFMKNPKIGYLKVSFFGPFYGSYVIFGLDEADYRYSFVSGADKSYLWLLARTPRVEDDVLDRFIKNADMLGFDTSKLIFVEHGARCGGAMFQQDEEKDA
ncbi:lipocalin family protein [Nitrosospira briensis]|uniref:lipocalin family protein n=1 Tax=Nitrosospira briensis TaxID=35799 RepID=UPI0008EF7662|nr:apolipoprotein D and lipocalin family protein [Nitrosospira briensis]